MKIINFLITLIIIANSIITPCLAEDNRIIPAEHEKNITIEKVTNDEAININNPSIEGLSVNDFEIFNADKNNVIVKNNMNDLEYKGQTLSHNPNLSTEASYVLFNTIGNEPSNLEKDLTIAGKKAEFILVNPNGIFCKGCAFINAAKTTLTTEDGKGKILLDNVATDGDMLAKAKEIELKGKPYIQGKASILVEKMVDGSHLDAMYAKQIYISSDDTIKLRGKLESPGKIEVNSKNYADLANSILAADEVDLHSQDILNLEEAKIGSRKVKLHGNKELTARKASIIAHEGKFSSRKGIDLKKADINIIDSGSFQAEHLRNFKGKIHSRNNLHFNLKELNNEMGIVFANNQIKLNSDNLFNKLGKFSANNLYFDIKNHTQNILGHIEADKNIYFTNGGTLLNFAGLIKAGSEIDLDIKELINKSGYQDNTKIDGEILANKIFVKAENLENDGRIIAGHTVEMKTAKINNTNLIEGKEQLSINTKAYKNSGQIKAGHFLMLGDFKETCDAEDNCNYEVNKDINFNYIKGNEFVGPNGQMAIYAQAFHNNARLDLNHSLFISLYGNSFTNNDLLEINGDFIVNDPVGAFINNGKIRVINGNAYLNVAKFISSRTSGGNVDFNYYEALGDVFSNKLFWDIYIDRDLVIKSANTVEFNNSKIAALGGINIEALHGIKNYLIYNEKEFVNGPQNLPHPFAITTNQDLVLTSLNGNIEITGGNITSSAGNIYLNAKNDIKLDSFSRFYIRTDLPPLNGYWAGNVLYDGRHLGFESLGKRGNPTAVNQPLNLTAPQGAIALTSTGGQIITKGVNFNSQEFESDSKDSSIFNAILYHDFSAGVHHWGGRVLPTTINAKEVSIYSDNQLKGNGLFVNSFTGIDKVKLQSRNNAEFSIASYTYPSGSCYGPCTITVAEPSKLVSDRDILVKSREGNISFKGSSVSSLGKVNLDAPNGQVDLISEAISTIKSSITKKRKLFSKTTTTHSWNEVDIYKTQIAGTQGVEINAKKLYTEGAEILAPQDKIIINTEIEEHRPLKFNSFDITNVTTKGFTATGILGRILEKDSLPPAARSKVRLHDSSPLVMAVKDAFNVHSPTDTAPIINLAIEGYKAFSGFAKNYKENGGNAAAAGGDLALNQLGISRDGYLIYPSGVGFFGTHYQRTENTQHALGTYIAGKEYISKSNELTLEGSSISGEDKVDIDTEKLTMLAAEQITETKEDFNRKAVMVSKKSVSGSESNRSSYEFSDKKIYSYIRGDNIVNVNTDELIQQGGVIEGKNPKIEAKNILVETLKDVYFRSDNNESKTAGIAIYGTTPVPSGSYSKGKSDIVSERVSEISGIKGLTVEVSADNAELIGGVIGGTQDTITDIKKVSFEDVHEKYEAKKHGVGITADGSFLQSSTWHNSLAPTLSKVKDSLFSKSFNAYKSHQLEEGVVKATIAGSNIDGLNNDLAKVREWQKVKDSTYSVMVPIVNAAERKEIVHNIKEIADVFKEVAQIEPLVPESTQYKEFYEEGLKRGLNKDEIKYVLEAFGKEELDARDDQATSITINPSFNRMDNKQLLIEYYGEESLIPIDKLDKLSEGRYYLHEGKLHFSNFDEVTKSHDKASYAAFHANKILDVANQLTEKYGASYEAALYAVSSLTGGFLPTAAAFAKTKLGEEAFGEYLTQGVDFTISKVANIVQQMDPYLSEQSARNIAAVAIIGTAAATGMTSDLKFALNPTTPKSSLLKTKHQNNDIHISKNNNHGDKGSISYSKTMPCNLAEHDAKGGHGKARHGGHLEEKYVAERIERDGIDKYGKYNTRYTAKFYNEEIETKVLNDITSKYATKVEDFKLNNNSMKKDLVINYKFDENIGHGTNHKIYDAGIKDKLPIHTNEVTVIFRKSELGEVYIHTMYPNVANKVASNPKIEIEVLNKLKEGK